MSYEIEMGEYVVSAYLKLIEKCDVVDYKVRRPVKGRAAQAEIDVIGFDFAHQKVFLCEAKTHIMGLYMGSSNIETIAKIRAQFNNMQLYAKEYLQDFPNVTYQLWAPYVPEGAQTVAYEKMLGLELIINKIYTQRIEALRRLANRNSKADVLQGDKGNPFFRSLQILGHLR